MRLLISTHVFRRRRLGAAQLDLLQKAGVEAVELFCSRRSFDYRNRAQVTEIADWFRSNPMTVHSLHSPIYRDEHEGRTGEPPINFADTEPRLRLLALDEIQSALDVAEHIPIRFVIQHIGVSREEWSQRKSDNAMTGIERLKLLTKQLGVTLLVENIPNGLSTPGRLISFLDHNHLDIGVCFDSGHAHMEAELFGGGGVEASWELLGKRVRSTHLHDNHGSADEHLWPGRGTIPWERLGALLGAAGDELPWMLEVGDHDDDLAQLPSRIAAAHEQLEKWAQAAHAAN